MVKETNTKVQLTIPKEVDVCLREIGYEMDIGRCDVIRIAISFFLELDSLERVYLLKNKTRNKQMVKETNTKVQLTIPKKVDARLKEIGYEMGVGRCGVIRIAIRFLLESDSLKRRY